MFVDVLICIVLLFSFAIPAHLLLLVFPHVVFHSLPPIHVSCAPSVGVVSPTWLYLPISCKGALFLLLALPFRAHG